MSRQLFTTRTAPSRDRDAQWFSAPRWLVTLAVLAGFVAMHGLSADHDVHALAGLPGGHHASALAGEGHGVAAGLAAVDAGQGGAAVAAAILVRQAPGQAGEGYVPVGCLVLLATSVLALLASLLARRAGVPLPALLPRVGSLPVPRVPPRRNAPGFFVLGILRT